GGRRRQSCRSGEPALPPEEARAARPAAFLFCFSHRGREPPTEPMMTAPHQAAPGKDEATRALAMSTIAFTICFAVWTIFSIIAVRIKDELGLTETEFGLLVGMIGGLGGFVLPIAFGALNDLTGLWSSCFMLLFAIVAVSFVWMHL